MNGNLNLRQKQILLNLSKNDIKQTLLAQKIIDGYSTEQEIEKMCSIISNEFLLNGITKDFEANEYGKELENILDNINRSRL